jgi:hypothetical protein
MRASGRNAAGNSTASAATAASMSASPGNMVALRLVQHPTHRPLAKGKAHVATIGAWALARIDAAQAGKTHGHLRVCRATVAAAHLGPFFAAAPGMCTDDRLFLSLLKVPASAAARLMPCVVRAMFRHSYFSVVYFRDSHEKAG